MQQVVDRDLTLEDWRGRAISLRQVRWFERPLVPGSRRNRNETGEGSWRGGETDDVS